MMSFFAKLVTCAALGGFLTGCMMAPKEAMGTDWALASWYSQGHRTANGERFNPNALTVAHRTLPFGTELKLTNEQTGKTVVARVNDRGPFVKGRTLDVTRGVAQKLGFKDKGMEHLRMEVLSRGEGSCTICQTIQY
jgi:rare lipoprotein A